MTETVTGDGFVQETEGIRIETGGGDDHLDVAWDAVSMSGLELFQVALCSGDNRMRFDLLPPAHELDGLQAVQLEVFGEAGDDAVFIVNSAGNWFDLEVNASLGTRDDTFTGILNPLPGDTPPDPDGPRSVSFEIVAGDEDHTVIVHNQTGEPFHKLMVSALLGGAEDLLEALGEMELFAEPASGFDTARVTHNVLQFVSESERVELFE